MRIRIHPTFPAYLCCAVVFSSWQNCLCALAALLVHEGGHYIASLIAGEPIQSMELTPFGGIMTYAPGKGPCKGLKGVWIASAGPLSNYLALFLIASESVQNALGQPLAREAAMANLCMGLLNLLPALPLDGGRLAFCVGYRFFPVSMLIRCLTVLGMCAGVLLILFAFYGFVSLGVLNCSLLIIGIYLIVCARKSKGVMLAESLYDIVAEHQEDNVQRIRRMRLYRIQSDTLLYELLESMERRESAAFIFEDKEGAHILLESMVYHHLLQSPSLAVSELSLEGSAKRQKNQTES